MYSRISTVIEASMGESSAISVGLLKVVYPLIFEEAKKKAVSRNDVFWGAVESIEQMYERNDDDLLLNPIWCTGLRNLSDQHAAQLKILLGVDFEYCDRSIKPDPKNREKNIQGPHVRCKFFDSSEGESLRQKIKFFLDIFNIEYCDSLEKLMGGHKRLNLITIEPSQYDKIERIFSNEMVAEFQDWQSFFSKKLRTLVDLEPIFDMLFLYDNLIEKARIAFQAVIEPESEDEEADSWDDSDASQDSFDEEESAEAAACEDVNDETSESDLEYKEEIFLSNFKHVLTSFGRAFIRQYGPQIEGGTKPLQMDQLNENQLKSICSLFDVPMGILRGTSFHVSKVAEYTGDEKYKLMQMLFMPERITNRFKSQTSLSGRFASRRLHTKSTSLIEGLKNEDVIEFVCSALAQFSRNVIQTNLSLFCVLPASDSTEEAMADPRGGEPLALSFAQLSLGARAEGGGGRKPDERPREDRSPRPDASEFEETDSMVLYYLALTKNKDPATDFVEASKEANLDERDSSPSPKPSDIRRRRISRVEDATKGDSVDFYNQKVRSTF